jgi:hypothetical protein
MRGGSVTAGIAAKQVQETDMVQFSERTLESNDFHEAFLQWQDERLPMGDAHQRAGSEPGDLKFAQMVWK